MPFPLLSLPPELRDQIYMFALVSPFPLILAPPKRQYHHHHRHQQWHPNTSLLRTCHQVSAEATPLLYAHNRFHFFSNRAYNTLYYFLVHIGPWNRSYLRNVGVPWPVMEPVLDWSGLRSVPVDRFHVRPVVAGVLGLLLATGAGSRSGGGVTLNVYHGQCAGDMEAEDGQFLTCDDACMAVVEFLDGLMLQKVFHASPLERWIGADPHCVLMSRLIEEVGWEIRLYAVNALDPSAEPVLVKQKSPPDVGRM